MAFQIFKGSKDERRTPKSALKEKKAEEKKEAVQQAPQKAKKYTLNQEVIFAPRVTEKATTLGEAGQYTFNVALGATKGQIKQIVSSMYGVTVTEVRIIRIPAKKIRVGRTQGIKGEFKKAIVQVAKGQKIEIVSR